MADCWERRLLVVGNLDAETDFDGQDESDHNRRGGVEVIFERTFGIDVTPVDVRDEHNHVDDRLKYGGRHADLLAHDLVLYEDAKRGDLLAPHLSFGHVRDKPLPGDLADFVNHLVRDDVTVRQVVTGRELIDEVLDGCGGGSDRQQNCIHVHPLRVSAIDAYI
jgi:hypothetical protein